MPYRASTTLMIQGCTSDAGKSLMVAGLIRLLHDKGVRVAPFKPQNMALNSAVTKEGGEIGRAQALQAKAAKLKPENDFNPILIKPSSDVGAQIIVHGQVMTNMQAQEFHDFKKTAMSYVLDSFARVEKEFEAVLVEGAGSPAEINLREGDIANMGFAEAVDCPVLLVADIDKGGVFAHIVGTLALLSESEQSRITGFIINKFRGDKALLDPGIEWLEQKTGKSVLAVVPFLHNLFLDAEDTIQQGQNTGVFRVVVPVLPRISNHTDFDALRVHPHVDMQFVSVDQRDVKADLIILPGSKNVIEDLITLKNAGWQKRLDKHLRYGGKIIGLCGGFQMLGKRIADPENIESARTQIDGFNYLDMTTVLEPEKQLTEVSGTLFSEHSSASAQGYEIHCGVSQYAPNRRPLLYLSDRQNSTLNRTEGVINADDNVVGSYVHGLFDDPHACDALLNWAGMNNGGAVNVEQLREQQLDRLAQAINDAAGKDFWRQTGLVSKGRQEQ